VDQEMNIWRPVEDTPERILQGELWDVLVVQRVVRNGDGTLAFEGRLQRDADEAFRLLKGRFSAHGYTPVLRRQHGRDVIVAMPGVARPAGRGRWWVHLGLFLATIVTTTFMGALLVGANPLFHPRGLWWGMWFAFGLLTILGVHELGHYVAARYHRVAVTLPYFIPIPLGLGTFGAFIQLKSPVEDRRALFDVGVAGPLAGLLVAVPLFVAGLMMSDLVAGLGGAGLGKSLLVDALVQWVHPHPPGYAVSLHPLALAAWFGLLVTGFNLLPAGQLDGGHIAYAVLGVRARWMTASVLLMLVALGWLYWPGWFIWAFFVALTGLRHPMPLNEITGLNGWRRLGALLSVALLAVTLTPSPF